MARTLTIRDDQEKIRSVLASREKAALEKREYWNTRTKREALRFKRESGEHIERALVNDWGHESVSLLQAALEGSPARICSELATMTDAETIRLRLLDEHRAIFESWRTSVVKALEHQMSLAPEVEEESVETVDAIEPEPVEPPAIELNADGTPKRKRGRPRIHPVKPEPLVKRRPGRPRKNSL